MIGGLELGEIIPFPDWIIPFPDWIIPFHVFKTSFRLLRRESHKKKLRNFGHMSKVGLPYLPSTIVWTKISLDNYSPVYPTYLSEKFGHFGNKVFS